MEAYAAGDARAFQRLFETLAPSVYGFFLRSVGSAALAEDLMQTTFLKLHDARASWRHDQRLRPWVFAIAAHVRADWLRRQGRAAEDLAEADEVPASPADDPGERVLHRERADRVRAAIERLAEPQRVVVQLHRFEGLSFEEIGQVLGISAGAAKLRAFRAYEQLRVLLADLVSEEPG
jgi:RNA polymerase sigma-70 factor, ECF subfamily